MGRVRMNSLKTMCEDKCVPETWKDETRLSWGSSSRAWQKTVKTERKLREDHDKAK